MTGTITRRTVLPILLSRILPPSRIITCTPRLIISTSVLTHARPRRVHQNLLHTACTRPAVPLSHLLLHRSSR
jgi:hypothetical protein